MMLKVIISFVGMVAMSSAGMSDMEPLPCCSNHKFTSLLMQVGGLVNLADLSSSKYMDNVFLMDYDYDMMMMKLVGTFLDSDKMVKQNLTIYQDYNNAKEYVVVDGTCYMNKMTRMMTPPCAKNASYDGSYMMGSGSNTFKVNRWTQMMGMNMTVQMHLMDSDCSPVATTVYGMDDAGTMSTVDSFVFGNVKQGTLSMRDPFTLPDMCMNAMMPVVGK